MGRKKYYCDYCDKTFNDDPTARSKHLQSARHLQLKDEHFKQFRHPQAILHDELTKKPCVNFHGDQSCRFGSNCRYSHYTPEQIEELRLQVDESSVQKHIPTFSEWNAEREQVQVKLPSPKMSHKISVPPEILPVSLRPFRLIDYLDATLPKWGDMST